MNFLIKKKKERKKPHFDGCGGCGSQNSKVMVMVMAECENCGRRRARSSIVREMDGSLPVMREG